MKLTLAILGEYVNTIIRIIGFIFSLPIIIIGRKAPWDNKIQIRVPLFIAKLLNHII